MKGLRKIIMTEVIALIEDNFGTLVFNISVLGARPNLLSPFSIWLIDHLIKLVENLAVYFFRAMFPSYGSICSNRSFFKIKILTN